jgi:hypothetical protein
MKNNFESASGRSVASCACGCKAEFSPRDSSGRTRKFVNGHNRRKYQGEDASKRMKNKRWAKRNPEKIRVGKRVFYRRRKLLAMKHLGNACYFCPVRYNGKNASIFEFHHIEPKEKVIGITRILTRLGWSKVLKELKKCVLVCANCHNQHHGGEW